MIPAKVLLVRGFADTTQAFRVDTLDGASALDTVFAWYRGQLSLRVRVVDFTPPPPPWYASPFVWWTAYALALVALLFLFLWLRSSVTELPPWDGYDDIDPDWTIE